MERVAQSHESLAHQCTEPAENADEVHGEDYPLSGKMTPAVLVVLKCPHGKCWSE